MSLEINGVDLQDQEGNITEGAKAADSRTGKSYYLYEVELASTCHKPYRRAERSLVPRRGVN